MSKKHDNNPGDRQPADHPVYCPPSPDYGKDRPLHISLALLRLLPAVWKKGKKDG